MILRKQVYYEGENEKKKVTIFEDDEKHFTSFIKTKGNGHVSVFETSGTDLKCTIKVLTEIFKIPISVED